MISNKLLTISLCLITFTLTQCKKEAGEGGTSTIKGRVLTKHLGPDPGGSGQLVVDTTYYENNEKVYIIYGTADNTYDDDYNTSFDGSYEFKYLQNGTYKVFVYSADTSGLSQGFIYENRPKVPMIQTVDIGDKNQVKDVPDIIIYKYL
jgi:hypothetical protein